MSHWLVLMQDIFYRCSRNTQYCYRLNVRNVPLFRNRLRLNPSHLTLTLQTSVKVILPMRIFTLTIAVAFVSTNTLDSTIDPFADYLMSRKNTPIPKNECANGEVRWPVSSRQIVLNYEKGKNDGIDISTPVGSKFTEVEEGKVAFTGDKLKGYAQIILIRHAGGTVSAYGYSSELLVETGDYVCAGEVIVLSGKPPPPGAGDQPCISSCGSAQQRGIQQHACRKNNQQRGDDVSLC